MIILYILLFIFCCVVLYFVAQMMVSSLTRISRFLGWREFVVAFFVMAFAGSLPNLFLGIFSAIHKIPHLSLGDVFGNNLISLTITVATGAMLAKGGLPAQSRTVQTTSIFTMVAALLPIFLIVDGALSRVDGLILIFLFVFYSKWLFSKKERFTRIYNSQRESPIKGFKLFFKDLGAVVLGIVLFAVAAETIVRSAQFFAETFHFPLILSGLFITGVGNALPEIYFSIFSAKRGDTWLILGNIMGAVIVPATLVLGIVALIHPIAVTNFSYFFLARAFLAIAALSFFLIARTGQKITKKESLFLLALYVIFVILLVIISR